MCITTHQLALLVAGLACLSNGRRLETPVGQPYSASVAKQKESGKFGCQSDTRAGARHTPDSLEVFAMFVHKINAVAAFDPVRATGQFVANACTRSPYANSASAQACASFGNPTIKKGHPQISGRQTRYTFCPARMSMGTPKPPDDENVTFTDLVVTNIRKRRDEIAVAAEIPATQVDFFLGCFLFFSLISVLRNGVMVLGFGSPDLMDAVAQLTAVSIFVMVQQLVFLPASEWLRLSGDLKSADPNPIFKISAITPLWGIQLAMLLFLFIAFPLQVAGIDYRMLPDPQPFPDFDGALLKLLVGPVIEEIFFRAWLLSAFEQAFGAFKFGAAGRPSPVLYSTVLYCACKVPLNEILVPFNPKPWLYGALGSYLSFVFQRAGNSLPLAVITHCTCNWIYLVLQDAHRLSLLNL